MRFARSFLIAAALAIPAGALAPAAFAMGGDGDAWHDFDEPGGYPGPYGPSSRSSFNNWDPRSFNGWDVGAPSALGIQAFQAGVAGSGIAPYYNGCFQERPAFNRHGDYVGSEWLYVCR